MAELFYNNRRVDGRRINELRKVTCSFGTLASDGSSLLQQGNTKVIASVFGPKACKIRGDAKSEEATVSCRYNKPPFASASGERRKVSSRDRIATDYASSLEEIFSYVIRLEKYPMSSIDIFVEVLQSDGSEFATAINAVSLALVDAGIEICNLVCASTVGLWGSHILPDLCNFEENSRVAQLTVVSLPSSSFAETGSKLPLEGARQSRVLHTRISCMPEAKLNTALEAALEVASCIYDELVFCIRSNVSSSSALCI